MTNNRPQTQETVSMSVQHNAEALIAKAIDKKVPVETMGRLLMMRRELKAEWAKKSLIKPWQHFNPNARLLEKQRASKPTTGISV